MAESYLGVLAHIAAEYNYIRAAAYDLVIHSKGERDPTFTAAKALPFYCELHMHTMLELKMRLTPPAHRSSASRPAATD